MGKLLRDQQYISQQRRMPVDNIAADAIKTVPSATIQLYYYNAGVLTSDAGQAAGVVVVGKFANRNIKNALGDVIGTNLDTSVAFTSTALTSLVKFPFDRAEAADTGTGTAKAVSITSGFSNGDYCIDHRTGTIYGVKASTQTSLTSCTYKVDMAVSGGGGGIASEVGITELGGETLGDHGTAVIDHGIQPLYEAVDFDGSPLPNTVTEGQAIRPKATESGVQLVMSVNEDGSAISSGASSTSAQYRATSNGQDGTVIYASASTLTLSGTPFTVNSEDLVYIREVDATGNTAEIFVNGSGGVHLEISSGTITKSGGTDFSANGVYELGYDGQDKAYNAASDGDQTLRLNPDSQNFTANANSETAQGDGTTNYYYTIDGWKNGFSVQIEDTPGAAGTNTYTIEASNQDDGTADASKVYQDITQYGMANMVGAAAASYTADVFLKNTSNFIPVTVKVKVVRSADGANLDGAWDVLFKKL